VIYGFPYVECGNCGHLFLSTQPTQEVMRRVYQEDGEVRRAQNALYMDDALFSRRVAHIARPKVEHVQSCVPGQGLWLDVGCASGEILSAAQDAGWRVQGIDADPGEVEFARRKGFNVTQDFLRADNSYKYVRDAQVVSALNIVEHLVEPSALVCAISSHLRSGTHAIIEVPRHPSLSSFAAMLYPQLACRHLFAPEHLHVFTEQSMALLLDRAGLRPVSIWTFGQDFQELISSAALATGIDESGFFQRVCDLTPVMQQAIDDADFSDVMFIVAMKE
jgi:2-polyprenyl-3-methyl-5-hydroxy-6-metoxy-1,4-benzoquinol methylase